MDTVVEVLAFSVVLPVDVSELWIAFCTGKTFLYIGAHKIAPNVVRYKAAALPLVHSFTGSDTVSSLTGRGQKMCWDVWKMFEPLTESLLNLTAAPAQLHLAELETIQIFTVLFYSRTCGLETVNEARKRLFAQGSRSIKHISSTL